MIGLSHTKISMILWRIIEPFNRPKIHFYVVNNTNNTLSSRLHWAQYHRLWLHVIATKSPILICCHCHTLAVAIPLLLLYFHRCHTFIVAIPSPLPYFCQTYNAQLFTQFTPTIPHHLAYGDCTLPPIPCCPYLAAHTLPLIPRRSYLAAHTSPLISRHPYLAAHICHGPNLPQISLD